MLPTPLSSTRRTISSGSWVASMLQASQTCTLSMRTTTPASLLPRWGRRLILPLVASLSSRRTPIGILRASPGRLQSLTLGAESMVISQLKVTLVQLSSTRRASWLPSCTPECPVACRTMLHLELLVTMSTRSSWNSTLMPISPASSTGTTTMTTQPQPEVSKLKSFLCCSASTITVISPCLFSILWSLVSNVCLSICCESLSLCLILFRVRN